MYLNGSYSSKVLLAETISINLINIVCFYQVFGVYKDHNPGDIAYIDLHLQLPYRHNITTFAFDVAFMNIKRV